MKLWRAAVTILFLAGAAAGATAQQQRLQRHNVTQDERDAARAALDAFTSPRLTRFVDEAEFRRYLEAIRTEQRTRGDYYYAAAATPQAPQRFAQATTPAQPPAQADTSGQDCVPTPGHPCYLPEQGAESVVVTGSRVAPPSNPSITNNQMRGVEEGDIIKQIDHYLLTLQDGRIFVTDIGTGRGQRLRLTDRANVYRYTNEESRYDSWYDEMLVSGDRILVTGYSYATGATEFATFRLDTRTGRLRREAVFRMTSNDYYDSNNYATRLIGDNLVVYTPHRLADLDDDEFVWPRVRPWSHEDDAREQTWLERRRRNARTPDALLGESGAPLAQGGDVYRPVERLDDAVIHAVSVCPLTAAARGAFACRTTAMVGPMARQWYVTADHAYLWTGAEGDYCSSDDERPVPTIANARRAVVYQVPLDGTPPALAGARGTPPDQFGLQADDRNLYALVRLESGRCQVSYRDPSQLAFATLSRAAFGPTLTALPQEAFVALPGTPTYSIAARFTERYLVYGGLSGYRRGLPDPNEFYRWDTRGYDTESDYNRWRFVGMRAMPAVVVPVGQPGRFRTLATGHTVIRADRLGDDIILTGYRDRSGLSVTLIDLNGTPRISSSVQLAGRYESEGRSHAFNSRTDPDGSSLMGLPTVPEVKDTDRDYWRSRASDLSFLAADRQGRLRPIGELQRRFDYVDGYDETTHQEDEDGVPGYQCEVSCIDWYGNSRPIFTDGRIFGLTGTELIEGRLVAGRIRDVQRLNIALSPVPGR